MEIVFFIKAKILNTVHDGISRILTALLSRILKVLKHVFNAHFIIFKKDFDQIRVWQFSILNCDNPRENIY